MIANLWTRVGAWFELRRKRGQIHRTDDAALPRLRDTASDEFITQPAGARRSDPEVWALSREMVAALRLDAAERETLDASIRLDVDADAHTDMLPHDPRRVDAAHRAALLKLARRIELLRGLEPG